MREQYISRAQFLFILMGLAALTVIAQLIRIQHSPEAKQFLAFRELYSYELRTFYPNRGNVYDRNGHLLAGNKSVYEVGADLNFVQDAHAIAFVVSNELGLDYAELLDRMQNPEANVTFVVLADFVEEEHVARLRQAEEITKQMSPEGGLVGLEFKAHPRRSYPEDVLGANLIGFVTHEGKGYFGVEEKYDMVLAGNPVQAWIPTDPNKAAEIPRAMDGAALVLTINRDLQASTEKILDGALDQYGAQRGTIVVMDPRNGEVLAMASSPRMNLNQFWEYGNIYDKASEYNPAISMPYEPGSVIKILTMAAALDTGTVTPQTTYLDTGAIIVGGVTIQNWDQQPWGEQSMVGCLQHSLNVCMALIATQMGTDNFYRYMNNFGLGHLTGIDLAGEAAGRLKHPNDGDWYPVDLGTNAFGQGVTATPIQMMMASSAVANRGKMVIPRTLYAMMRDGREYKSSAQFAGSPISEQTALTLSEMLAVSLEQEASLALVPGYRVAGKTGTAQIPVNGFYDKTQTNTSFIGWGPIDDPRFMIYVWLERPTSSIWGSETAAPVFSEVAQQVVLLLDIPPDAIRRQLVNH